MDHEASDERRRQVAARLEGRADDEVARFRRAVLQLAASLARDVAPARG